MGFGHYPKSFFDQWAYEVYALYMQRSKSIFGVVTGTIGAGKTTLLKKIKKEFKLPLYEEDSEKNPILEGYFKDPEKWGYWSQLFFGSRRLFFHQLATTRGGLLERHLSEAILFANLEFDRNIITLEQHSIITEQWKTLLDTISTPDFMIFLRTSPNIAYQRVLDRGRPEELEINSNFVNSLTTAYEKHLKEGLLRPSFIIDTDSLSSDMVFEEARKHIQNL